MLRDKKQRWMRWERWLALAVISVTCWQNFKFGPILMPRSLTVSEYGSCVVDNKKGCDKQCGPSSKRLHLDREMASCQSIDHLCMWLRCSWKVDADAWVDTSEYNLTSSAKSLTFMLSPRLSVMSLMNKLKRAGPRTLPWTIPLDTGQKLDRVEPTRTHWERLVINASIQNKRLPEIP